MSRNLYKQTNPKGTVLSGKQRSYGEIIEYLDSHWLPKETPANLTTLAQLDQALGSLSSKVRTILVTGINGKSLTAHFIGRLLHEEKISFGIMYAPHILNYNERLVLNNEMISNKLFTEIANEVISAAENLQLTFSSFDILTMMALLYFHHNKVDVAILETDNAEKVSAISLCHPCIVAVTRITNNHHELPEGLNAKIRSVLNCIRPNTRVISADQSKLSLHVMQSIVESMNGIWSMPLRKLADLEYPYGQLHGRSAALAERVSYFFINDIINKELVIVADGLLTKQKGKRGRPTTAKKRHLELNPKRTINQFWEENLSSLPARFQLLEKEKPVILLDTASNFDAFVNLFRGIKLLHYQRPLKGLSMIVGCDSKLQNDHEFLKLIRYFFKKTSGQIIICPLEKVAGHVTDQSWDTEKVAHDIRAMKIKVSTAAHFDEAFDAAQKTVDERDGLIVIAGSSMIINSYWRYKGIKKVQ